MRLIVQVVLQRSLHMQQLEGKYREAGVEITGIRGNKLHFSRVVRMGIIEKASES